MIYKPSVHLFNNINQPRCALFAPWPNEVALQAANVIIPSGTRAMVTGLVTETQYNGLWATIQGFDRQLLRYTVKIGQGKQLRLRLENCLLGGPAACGMRPSPTVRRPPSPLPPLAARKCMAASASRAPAA